MVEMSREILLSGNSFGIATGMTGLVVYQFKAKGDDVRDCRPSRTTWDGPGPRGSSPTICLSLRTDARPREGGRLTFDDPQVIPP